MTNKEMIEPWRQYGVRLEKTVKPDEAESRTAEEFAPQLQLKQLGFA